MMTTFLPAVTFPARRSQAWTTFGLSLPGISGCIGLAPVAITTASGDRSFINWISASLPSNISTFRASKFLARSAPAVISSSLPGMWRFRRSCPPKISCFSTRLTLWPRSVRVQAAFMPAGPPPITRTFLGSAGGRYESSPSLPAHGLTRQVAGFDLKMLSKHP